MNCYLITSTTKLNIKSPHSYYVDSLTINQSHIQLLLTMPKYDWYICINDASFIDKNKLTELLNTYDCNESYCIGNKVDYLTINHMSTYIISKHLCELIRSYIEANELGNLYDVSLYAIIQELSTTQSIEIIHNSNLDVHPNNKTDDSIIVYPVTQEQYALYNKPIAGVFTLVTDLNYWNRAKRTIQELRGNGKWKGTIVLITIDFELDEEFKNTYSVTEKKFDVIDTSALLKRIGPEGFSNSDKRELHKLSQWEKLHVFDDYFKQWKWVVYLDAGLSIVEDVSSLIELDCTNKILAPQDGDKRFNEQVSYDKPQYINAMCSKYGKDILDSTFMLNCMWMYDTAILDKCNKHELIQGMNDYPCCKTNEMAIMNLFFHFKYNLWEPFPEKLNHKFLFTWIEKDSLSWKDYCFIKYSRTIDYKNELKS